MSDVHSAAASPPHVSKWGRGILLLFLIAIIGLVVYVMFATPWGARLRADPHVAGAEFHAWVDGHGWIAPAVFLAMYLAASISLLPVWWLQILAGYGFGMYVGLGLALTGSTLGALASFAMSRGLLADWVRNSFEARHEKLKALDEKMGHNGLMIVMAARLTHVVPFGISNYLFGLTRINWLEVGLGTILGNLPMIAVYVATGAGLEPWKNWKFMTVIGVINVLLLLPIGLRYWKPDAFKKIGVE